MTRLIDFRSNETVDVDTIKYIVELYTQELKEKVETYREVVKLLQEKYFELETKYDTQIKCLHLEIKQLKENKNGG